MCVRGLDGENTSPQVHLSSRGGTQIPTPLLCVPILEARVLYIVYLVLHSFARLLSFVSVLFTMTPSIVPKYE